EVALDKNAGLHGHFDVIAAARGNDIGSTSFCSTNYLIRAGTAGTGDPDSSQYSECLGPGDVGADVIALQFVTWRPVWRSGADENAGARWWWGDYVSGSKCRSADGVIRGTP